MSSAEPPPSNGSTPGQPAGEPQKTLWDRVLTTTPIVLTIVATALAGMSSGEMTRAQYYRALAAQYQSKVSDQWNFFQAKRIRGTSMEVTIGVLQSLSGRGEVTASALESAAGRVAEELHRCEQHADLLLAAVTADRADRGDAHQRMRRAVEELKQTTAALAKQAAQERQKMAETLADPRVRASLDYLSSKKLPAREGEDRDPRKLLAEMLEAINPALSEGLGDIAGRKTERQMARTLGKIREEEIHDAIDRTEEKAASADQLADEAGAAHAILGERIAALRDLVRAFHRALQETNLALSVRPPQGQGTAGLWAAAADLGRRDNDLRTTADDIGNNFQAARLDYNARRYEREARYNQVIAGLHELQVRKAGLASDRHLQRSRNFFYAMLAAQAGVTLGTFALAVRQRSILWAMATLAGLSGIAIGGYVYLKM
jgi:hypothetical protein